MGPPGIGKTAIMEQIVGDLGVGLVSYSMTHHTRQSALGLPFSEKKMYGGQDPTNRMSQVGLDLDVIDHYNGTTRPINSLSGGESFKALPCIGTRSVGRDPILCRRRTIGHYVC